MPEPHLRAADADREAVARRLAEHMAVGRITLPEYEERVTAAWSATTYGDLAALTADLPAPASAATQPGPSAPAALAARVPDRAHGCGGGPRKGSARDAWAAWLGTAVVVLTIWAVTWLASGRAGYFWPVWVIGPWGAALCIGTLTGTRARHDRSPVRS
jgi:hypothetical protein